MGSPEANSSLIPSLSLTMKGGSQFAVYDPVIVISTQVSFFFRYFVLLNNLQHLLLSMNLTNDLQNEIVYCLAVVKSAELNIIGRKFVLANQS